MGGRGPAGPCMAQHHLGSQGREDEVDLAQADSPGIVLNLGNANLLEPQQGTQASLRQSSRLAQGLDQFGEVARRDDGIVHGLSLNDDECNSSLIGDDDSRLKTPREQLVAQAGRSSARHGGQFRTSSLLICALDVEARRAILNSDLWPIPAPLRAVVAEAYRVFRGVDDQALAKLDVCLGCCVLEQTARELREWPLARLTDRHFYDYNTSAKSACQPADELRHLLPRLLELLAEGAQVHHSIELALERLGNCPPGSWTPEEIDVLQRFALAYFDHLLHGDPSGESFLEDPVGALLMFDIGGLSIEPLLDFWLNCENPSSADFVVATAWRIGARGFENAFADNRPLFQVRIREWFLDPENQQRFWIRSTQA